MVPQRRIEVVTMAVVMVTARNMVMAGGPWLGG